MIKKCWSVGVFLRKSFSEVFSFRKKGGFILLYHRVADVKDDPLLLSVSKSNFRDQVEWLSGKLRIVPLYEMVERIIKGKSLKGLVSITFDDGYSDNFYNALPILSRISIPATFFVAYGFLGGNRFYWDKNPASSGRPLSVAELVRFSRSNLVEIGSHTWSHPRLSNISSFEDYFKEIVVSKEALEAIVGKKIVSFSYPFGSFLDIDFYSYRLVRKSYKYACANFEGMVFGHTDRWLLPRLVVRNWRLESFIQWIKGFRM